MMEAPPAMQGKLCLVTGATQGIGRATAVALSRMGATVALVARDQGRGEEALAEVRRASPTADGELFSADLSSQRSIRAFARSFRERHAALDVLVNNAGGIFHERAVTEDGLERTFATNHLAYFLVTHLLLDLLLRAAPSRIVNVASVVHSLGTIDFDDLQGERAFGQWKSYNQSKLANVLFTLELARRLEGTGVTANCLHPGVVGSNFGQSAGLLGFGMSLAAPFMTSPQKGARTTIYLASSPEVLGVSGRYWSNLRPKQPSKEARDPGVARRLWDVSCRLTGIDVEADTP